VGRVNIDLNLTSILVSQVAHVKEEKLFCCLDGKHIKGEFEINQLLL